METKKKRGENRRNKEKPAILIITTSMVHTHTYTYIRTDREARTDSFSLGVVLLEIQQFSKKIVHFCVAEGTLYLHVLHDFQRDSLEWGQTQEKL